MNEPQYPCLKNHQLYQAEPISTQISWAYQAKPISTQISWACAQLVFFIIIAFYTYTSNPPSLRVD